MRAEGASKQYAIDTLMGRTPTANAEPDTPAEEDAKAPARTRSHPLAPARPTSHPLAPARTRSVAEAHGRALGLCVGRLPLDLLASLDVGRLAASTACG